MIVRLSPNRSDRVPDLVDLLAECHERIRRFAALACDVAIRRDAPAEQIAEACASVRRYFTEALPLHVADEDASIEPRLRGLSPEIDYALAVMSRQHAEHAPTIERLIGAVARVASDPENTRAREQLRPIARALQRDLEDHLAVEESVLFPALRMRLSGDERALILRELRARRRGLPGFSRG